ncbi:prolipoprotein diacylglyceryl transferase [Candidatus Roizmanbacteria bacterium]|nr:prolipoprotein diacylglyceryl transferase [Candidatus Roizmanbacteria bacterium]
MLPVLLDLKFIKIYTFGVFLVLAFFWSSFILWRTVRLTTYKEEDIFDGLFFMLGGALFGGRIVYVLSHFDKFGVDVLKFILINGYPGLSLYGALGGALLTLFLFFGIKKIKFPDVIDYFIPAFFLATAIGKLGSFLSGVEIGAKTHFFLAIHYTNMDGLRHLTSFYESLFFFLGAFLSYQLLFEIRRDKYQKGFQLVFFIWYFSVVYFVFDPLKAKMSFLYGMSLNYVVSLILLLTFSIYLIYYFRSLLQSKTIGIINLLFRYGTRSFRSGKTTGKKITGREEGPSETNS